MDFEWDSKKEDLNLLKHKVSFTEATESFYDPLGFSLKDTLHSDTEERHYWVGKTFDGRIITTRYVLRNKVIRIIGSAEWRKFREVYYERTKTKRS